jgi:hypothetical protein
MSRFAKKINHKEHKVPHDLYEHIMRGVSRAQNEEMLTTRRFLVLWVWGLFWEVLCWVL